MNQEPGGGPARVGSGKPIRVLVVDDSLPQRMMLVAALDADDELEVVGYASDGEEAVRRAAMLKPDVITMDLRMPVLDGLEATRRIMQKTPTPIVMVTASASRENQRLAFDAFEAGVLAVLEKPTAGPDGRIDTRELLQTVKSMSRVRVVRRWARERLSPPLSAPSPPAVRPRQGGVQVVVIGSSTGGPQALQQILASLPASFPLPVLLVQHIAHGFTTGLVDWLRSLCALPIEIAALGTPWNRPAIYVAPTGQHMTVRGRTLALSDAPLVSGHRPSATVLFQSLARVCGSSTVGVLLTGMGDDGAVGLRDLKRAGGVTIAQDRESSVVFGMPGVAIAMGVVDYTLPPSRIGSLLVELAARGREESGNGSDSLR